VNQGIYKEVTEFYMFLHLNEIELKVGLTKNLRHKFEKDFDAIYPIFNFGANILNNEAARAKNRF
jgi:hypothetical protein